MSARRVPWSEEAEQSVLGGLLLDNRASTTVREVGLHAAHFYAEQHAKIFTTIMAQISAGHPADIITVFEGLGQAADGVGGMAYLNALAQSVPSASNVRRYSEIVIERALDRQLVAAADNALTIATGPGEAQDKRDRISSLFNAVRMPTAHAGPQPVAALVAERVSHWQDLADGSVVPGTATGLQSLDRALGGGPKGGKVLVIASRPSVGKTALACEIALAFGRAGQPSLFLSQEMTGGELIDRFVANAGRIQLEAVTTGRIDDVSDRLCEAGETVSRMPLFIDDTPALSLLDIRAKACQIHQRHGLGLLVLDYLQLSRDSGNTNNRHHQIEGISRGMKQLAKELNCAVVVLSQINRSSLQRTDGEPTLADLKESGAIEEDADAVLLLHPREQMADGSMLVVGILAKNRQGRRGRIALRFEGATQRWSESTADVTRRGGNA